jgi:hypothetical protein
MKIAMKHSVRMLLILTLSAYTVQAQTLPENSANIGIQIAVNRVKIGEGANVVLNVIAQDRHNQPAAHLALHAQVNGKDWGAEYLTLPSGVAHMLLPLPEQGKNRIVVTDGVHVSNAVEVQVEPRHFNIVEDPNHLVILEYETWFGPGYAAWGHEEATPILGHYSSLDPRVLRQQALWFNQLGINVVETDWTNNLAEPFPGRHAKQCIQATDELFRVYASMKQHPKILFLMGPENERWYNNRDVYNGPQYNQQLNYVYDHYINNPQYRDMYLTYEGKPLLLLYLNGPRKGVPPDIHDARFTIRYVGAWLQSTHQEKYGVWSWYDQEPTPIYHNGTVEALTVTSGYPAEHRTATDLDNWLPLEAGGKNYGETYLSQWSAALQYRPHFLFINQWNEFVPPDQYNANMSNDLEPTLMTEKDDPRASGWGFYYFNLTSEMIGEYHRVLQTKN